MIIKCVVCGGHLPEIKDDFYDSCRKKFETFIIAGEQRPSELEGKYVFWMDPETKEPLRPRMERKCQQCGFAYDVYHWVPPT